MATSKRRVTCTYCGHEAEVSGRAMSMVCPKCSKRLNLENQHIVRYHPVSELRTCGDVLVDKKGNVPAPILAENLTVLGQVRGNVSVRQRVSIGKTGTIEGDIVTPRLAVEDGGAIVGFVRVTPPPVATGDAAQRAAAEPGPAKSAKAAKSAKSAAPAKAAAAASATPAKPTSASTGKLRRAAGRSTTPRRKTT